MEADRTHRGRATFVKKGLQYRRVGIKGNLECIAVEVWDSQNHRVGTNSSVIFLNDYAGDNGSPNKMGVQSDTKSLRVQDVVQLVLITESR